MRERERERWMMDRVNNELQIINNSKMNSNTSYVNTTKIFNVTKTTTTEALCWESDQGPTC